jgi:hypothetical protein
LGIYGIVLTFNVAVTLALTLVYSKLEAGVTGLSGLKTRNGDARRAQTGDAREIRR